MSNHLAVGTVAVHELQNGQSLRRRAEEFLSLSDSELAKVDPALMNLLVAKGIPSLHDLDIPRYLKMLDEWAEAIRSRLRAGDANYYRNPERFRNDIRFGRLALMCYCVGSLFDIHYREDQKNVAQVLYTDPGDLFLNGVIDTRRGTCSNMALVYVALGWRLG